MTKRNKQFNAEFKQDAVNYFYSSGKGLNKAAADLKCWSVHICEMGIRCQEKRWLNSSQRFRQTGTLIRRLPIPSG